MAIFSKQNSLTGSRVQISVDSFRTQKVYVTLATPNATVYIGSSTVDGSNNAGYTLFNATGALNYASAVFDVPQGEKLYAYGTGTVNVTVIPAGK